MLYPEDRIAFSRLLNFKTVLAILLYNSRIEIRNVLCNIRNVILRKLNVK